MYSTSTKHCRAIHGDSQLISYKRHNLVNYVVYIHINFQAVTGDDAVLNAISIFTSSSAVAEKPCCRVSFFMWVVGDGMGQTILCTKRCRCQKTRSIDLLHDKSTFIRKTATLRFSAPL